MALALVFGNTDVLSRPKLHEIERQRLVDSLQIKHFLLASVHTECGGCDQLSQYTECSYADTFVEFRNRFAVLVAGRDVAPLTALATRRRAFVSTAPSSVEALPAALSFEAFFSKVLG